MRDETDFVLANADATVRSVQVCVTAAAGLQFQRLSWRIKGPDPREGDIQMLDHQFAAALEHRLKLNARIERQRHFGIQGRNPDPFVEQLLGPGALLDLSMQFLVGSLQRALGLLPFCDIGDECLEDVPATPFDSGDSDFQWNVAPVGSACDPLETSTAPLHAFVDISDGHDFGTLAIWLKG